MGASEMILKHRYGAELKVGMRINTSTTPNVYVLRRLDKITIDTYNQHVALTLSDGLILDTNLVSSWYVEV